MSERPGASMRWPAEFVVIVLGVLVALGADRWNQGRLERDLAEDYAARIVAELSADSARLASEFEAAQARRAEGLQLLDAIRGSASDESVRNLYRRCAGWAVPTLGGATVEEMRSTGSLRLLAPTTRQTLLDYYGSAEGTIGRIEEARRVLRDPFNAFGQQNGMFLTEVVPDAEFAERLRAHPDIEGLVLGCIGLHMGAAGLIRNWVNRLSEVLAEVRASEPS